MTINPKQLEIEAAYVQDAYMAMEDEVMKMLVRQLNKPTKTRLTEDNAFRWKIEKMQQLNLLNQQSLQQLVNETSQYSYNQLRKIIVDMGFEVVSDFDKNLSKQTGKEPPPRTEIDNVMESYFNQQWRDLDNHVNQTLIDTNYPNNPLAKMYQQVLKEQNEKTAQEKLAKKEEELARKEIRLEYREKAQEEGLPLKIIDLIDCSDAEKAETSYKLAKEIFGETTAKKKKKQFVSGGNPQSGSPDQLDPFLAGLKGK